MKKGWQEKKLGDVAELSGRIGWKGLSAKEYTKEGPLFLSVHSLNYGDYVDFSEAFHISQERYDESPEIMLQKDDILICKDGAGIGKVGMIGKLPDKTTINSSLLLIRRKKEEVITKYLYFSLLSPGFQSIINSRLMGATTPHLYQRDIVGFPVFVPSLSEQQRVVSVLDEAFASIAQAKSNAERNLVNARELFDSYLHVIFETPGKNWEICALDKYVKFIDYRGHTPTKTESGMRLITAKNVKLGFLQRTPEEFVDPKIYDSWMVRGFPVKGDVLFTTEAPLANIAQLDTDEKVLFAQRIIRLYRK